MTNVHPPRLASLDVGDRFIIKTGKRRVFYVGDRSYFQKDQRRYLCRVLEVKHERYRDRWGRPELRCVCGVEVVGT